MGAVLNAFRQLASPPVFENEELTQRARIFHRVTLSTMGVATPLIALVAILNPHLWARGVFSILVVNSLGGALLQANRRGHTKVASQLFVAGLITLVTVLSINAGGIRSPGVTMYFVFVLMAGLLLGERAGIITATICAAIGFVLVTVDLLGYFPEQTTFYKPVAFWVLNCLFMGVVLVLLRLSTDALTGALARAESELRERRASERERERLVRELRLLHRAQQLLHDRPYDRGVLTELVRLIPFAWEHPEICHARVAFLGDEATTHSWRESPWELSVPIITSFGEGSIAVRCTKLGNASLATPFLAEGQSVLMSLAEMMVAYLERDQAERRRQTVEAQLLRSQKMEALGTLAGGIAHDFNNILTAIVAHSELGSADLDPKHRSQEAFEEITKASARASDLVKRILLFSRKQEAERKVIPLQPVVEEAINLVRVSLPKTVRVEMVCGERVPPVSGDPSQLHQVVMNLATNASHAMAASGGILSVVMQAVTVSAVDAELSADLRPGRYVRVSVSDTGTGMNKATLERVFEPFFTTKGHGGTGLGLSVVHGIVREHNGAITVHSDPGRGTTFRVYLPAAADAEVAAPPRPIAHPGHGEHIMYVDDEVALVAVMERSLRRLGYRCTGYSDPAAALQAFRADPDAYDAVMTDIRMPKMSGIDLTLALRAIAPDLRVALVSGYSDDANVDKAGVTTRIQKPFSIETLAAAVHELLAKPATAPAV